MSACLKAGADPNVRAEDGSTPLHWAAINGHVEAVAALLMAGADPNLRNDYGITSLDIAEDGTETHRLLLRANDL